MRQTRTKWTDRRPRSSPSSSGQHSVAPRLPLRRPLHCTQEQESRTGPPAENPTFIFRSLSFNPRPEGLALSSYLRSHAEPLSSVGCQWGRLGPPTRLTRSQPEAQLQARAAHCGTSSPGRSLSLEHSPAAPHSGWQSVRAMVGYHAVAGPALGPYGPGHGRPVTVPWWAP